MTRRILLGALLAVVSARAVETAHDIVKRALDVDNRDWERARDYTYRQTEIIREIDSAGKTTSTRSRTHDVLILYGRPFSRLVEKDGKPLSESERRKEDEKLQKAIETRKRSADPSSKEYRKWMKQRAEQRKYLNEVLDAFDFRIAGEESLDGRPAWIIEGTPRPGYKPREPRAKLLAKLAGRMWIDKEAYEWVRIDAKVTGTISFGLVLARLSPGSSIHVEKRRVNHEVWLPSKVEIGLEGRLALIKKIRTTVQIDYSDYRKFQADSKVISTEAVP